MGLFDQFPYTNFHELNLMWILEALKEIQTTTEQFVALNSLKYADPIQWNIIQQYEKNTIVIDPLTGTAYISVQPVPSGVAITNTDYWTVVFDLGSFVTKAAQNFTTRWEEETTLTATFPTNAGDWLIWGNTLYKALVNITAGDQYVINSNIEHFTMEELYTEISQLIQDLNDKIGSLDDLLTVNTSSIVNAINSVLTDTIGDLDSLQTTAKDNVVDAVNELVDTRGDLDTLQTTEKSSVVGAINELADNIGDLDLLQTTDKDSVVDAVNELVDDQKKFDSLYVIDYIQDSDNGDIGLAIQRCVDIAQNGRTYSTRIILPKGRYTIKTPVFIDKKEGMIIEGAGRLNTILVADGSMLFDDNTGYPDSYAANAFFIVALDRDYGSGTPNPVYGYAEYYLTFKDFSMIDPTASKTIAAIFGYGIASSLYQNIRCEGLKYFIEFGVATSQGLSTSVGAWTSRLEGIQVKDCIGFNHIDRGTSLTYLNCSLNDSVEGYHIQTQYTDLIACTSEVWDKDHYAYDFDNSPCVNVINCGCEQGHGGLFHVHGNESSVNFIGCFLTGVIANDSTLVAQRMNLITDRATVVFNNCSVHLIKIVGGVQQRQIMQLAQNAEVTVIGTGRYSGNILRPVVGSIYDFVKVDSTARLFVPEFNGQIATAAWTADAITGSAEILTDEFTLAPGMYHIYVDYPVIDGGSGTIATSLRAISGSFTKVSYSTTFSGGTYAQQHMIISVTADTTLAIQSASSTNRTLTGINNAGVTIVRIK